MSSKLVKHYKDSCYIMTNVATRAKDYYSFLKNFVRIPLIIISSLMCLSNTDTGSVFEPETLRIINIIFNAFTAFLLALEREMRFAENADKFHKLSNDFNAIYHTLEITPTNEVNIKEISNKYQELIKKIEYLPNIIKNRVKKEYDSKYKLPSIIGDSIDEELDDEISNKKLPTIIDDSLTIISQE